MVRLLSLIVITISVVMIVSTLIQFQRRKITAAWAMFWSGLWVLGSVATFFTDWLDRLASDLLGLDGRLLVIYGSIIFLLLASYRLFLRQKSLQADLSRMIEEVAKKDAERGKRK